MSGKPASQGDAMPVRTISAIEGGVDVDGFACHFQVSGARESGQVPVFFVSGAFQTMRSWRPFAERFEPTTTVLLADLPGTGRSDLLPREFGIDFLARAAHDVLRAAGIARAYVVGASYGSPIAYTLAQHHPDVVDRLVLAGVMRKIPAHLHDATERTITTVREGRMAEFADDVVEGMLCRDPGTRITHRELAEKVLRRIEHLSEGDQHRYIENTARLLRHPALDLGSPPAMPTLVFTGESDVYTTPEDCREVAAALPDATFTTIGEADHLFHLEQFDATVGLIETFHRDGDLESVPGCAPLERYTAVGSVLAPA
jgi:pimeloyl-ACP methyl ester carboxylesterase